MFYSFVAMFEMLISGFVQYMRGCRSILRPVEAASTVSKSSINKSFCLKKKLIAYQKCRILMILQYLPSEGSLKEAHFLCIM